MCRNISSSNSGSLHFTVRVQVHHPYLNPSLRFQRDRVTKEGNLCTKHRLIDLTNIGYNYFVSLPVV